MADFQPGETVWIERLGNLRNVIRQEVIGRQLGDHVQPEMTILDVGCGQGTQLLRLAASGCVVTGVDPSATLRDLFITDADAKGLEVEVLDGTIETLDQQLATRTFDVVCAHGLLMYLPDQSQAIRTLSRHVSPDGKLSITFRNGHAMAMRHGLRRDWSRALAAFDNHEYVNELGVAATAHRLEDVAADLSQGGFTVTDWYGVRVFNDAVSVDMDVPIDEDIEALLDAEDRAGRRDPYRWMASMLHVIAIRQTGS
jgi:S-adenosylmethionine-dependent methyltransferase